MSATDNNPVPRLTIRLRDSLVYTLVRMTVPILGLIPLGVLYPLARLCGTCCYHLLHRDRERALLNLRLAFADRLSGRRLHLIVKGMFIHLSMMAVECARMYANPRNRYTGRIVANDFGRVSEGIARGHGLVILTAHFGNWELVGTESFRRGFTGLVLTRKIRSPRFHALVKRWRQRLGVLEWNTDESPKALLICLKNNGCIGVVNDQDIHRASGIFVDFFGIPAHTPRLVSELSYKTGAVLAVSLVHRQKNQTHIFRIFPLIAPREGEDKETYVLRSMREYADLLEKAIRHHPTQWVWFHRRWKTRPK